MYIAKLNNVDSTSFSLNDIPHEYRKVAKAYQTSPLNQVNIKCFRYKNKTGIFEVYIFLSPHFNIQFYGTIISNSYVIAGPMKLQIYNNGNVCFWNNDFPNEKSTKKPTGFYLDPKDAEYIIDFINETKDFSNHLKNKYNKKE